jgi:PTH2 family peptidyl-tRNA hydrolase
MCTKYFRLVKKSLERSGVRLLYSGGDLKQVYMVRTDLDMGKGKIAAQCCHAAVKAYRGMIENLEGSRKVLDRWENQGSRKVVLKVSSEEELVDIISKAKAKGLYATTIRDAGLTQIASGSMTVGVIGPATDTIIDEVSGHLKLL